ncbi:MAG: bifunctional 2-polyprenyl-6-hydroxyphenol methylase/3-demethylubiquinol 3-O-methyltransferase UbiG [Piscirickettsiaceae bacterium]|nr:bifunctional 2-polyprenyl-6-hydroxyphenol methylase/3-demethylubiquinol 3-O-methyltransferase UbiG [Piscirickettsiaceae bacterium]
MKKIHDNVDMSEIDKFNALASSWWNKEGKSKPLHQINPLRLSYINNISNLKGKRVIDVGCGGGILTESLAKNKAITTGIDVSKLPLEIAKTHAIEAKLNIDYQYITAEDKVKQSTHEFNIVTCMEMLEHVPKPSLIIEACSQLAEPNGDVFFSTLNRHPKAYLMAVLGAEYMIKILPKGTHNYQRFIRPSEIATWCRQASLEVIDITGLIYNPFSKAFKFSKDIRVNYLVHCRKSL